MFQSASRGKQRMEHRWGDRRPLPLQGRVVRHGSTGVGVEWEEFASETLDEIVQIATSIPPHPIDMTLEGARSLEFWTLAIAGVSNEKLRVIEP
jgi:hypothetical protein